MYVTTSKRGRHAIGLVCKRDGRHLRGFVNDAPFVASTMAKIAEAAGVPVEQVAPPVAPPAADPEALQNNNGGPAPKRSAKRRGSG